MSKYDFSALGFLREQEQDNGLMAKKGLEGKLYWLENEMKFLFSSFAETLNVYPSFSYSYNPFHHFGKEVVFSAVVLLSRNNVEVKLVSEVLGNGDRRYSWELSIVNLICGERFKEDEFQAIRRRIIYFLSKRSG